MTIAISIETQELWQEKRHSDLWAEFSALGYVYDMPWQEFLDQRYKEYKDDLIKQATDNYYTFAVEYTKSVRRSLDGKETQ